jgi:hypothetical protein
MRRLAALLSVALVLVGCGEDDSPAPLQTVTTSPPSTVERGETDATPAGGSFVRIVSPAAGQAVPSPLFIEGEARLPEDRLVVSVRTAAGVEVCAAPVRVRPAAGAPGSWSVHIGLRPPPQPGGLVVQAFAVRVPNGQLELMDEVPVRLETGDPAILVTSPRCGETVGTTVTVEGTASVFEGTVQLTAFDLSGTPLAESFTTATQGAPGRGPFSGTLELPPGTSGPVLIEAWSASAEHSGAEHVFGVPVFVNP